MKVLWFTNILMPAAAKFIGRAEPTGSGWWMSLLLDRLATHADIQLAVVAQAGLRDCRFKADGVEYFVVKTPWLTGVRNRLGSYKDSAPVESQLKKLGEIVNEWNPDVIHVHGTESSNGLVKARGFTDKPVVVSIQGLMAPYARKAYGDLLPEEVHGRFRSVFGKTPLCLHRWKSFRARIPIEAEVLRSSEIVLGRTLWDYAWASAYQPDVRYRHADELIRPEFFEAATWQLNTCRRHQVFSTTGGQPLKGLHVLLEAIHMLRPTFPNVRLNIASDGFVPKPANDYARFILNLIRQWDLESTVTFLGVQNGKGLVDELRQAHCFVSPSFIENSSNALQEAMLVGIPCVTSSAGGASTIVDSERTGLTFPAGDAALLAHQMRRIFEDDDLAIRLGCNGEQAGQARNNPDKIVAEVLAAYKEAVTLKASVNVQ